MDKSSSLLKSVVSPLHFLPFMVLRPFLFIKIRSSEDKVKQLKTAMGLNGDAESDEAISMISDNTAKLTSAVSSLPELLEKKRLIDLHMTVATSVLDEIKARKLDVYFEVSLLKWK